MRPSIVTKGLAIAVVLQLLLLIGMVVKAAMPLWTGAEILVKTVPVDPRSMFRGNYARLRYEIGSLPETTIFDVPNIRIGEIVYVSLEPDEDGLHSFANASLERPNSGVFIRGRMQNEIPPYRVKYGIEAFFAPKSDALELEKELRAGGIAVLMIADDGRAALKDVRGDVK